MNSAICARPGLLHAGVRTRSGVTLIEMLVGILVGAAILTSTVTLVSRVLAANGAATEHLHSVQAIGELGRQFREDVHRTVQVTASDDGPPRLTLELDDGAQVVYQAMPAGVTREKTGRSQPTRREVYALGRYELLEARRTDDEAGAVQLVLARVARHVDAEIVRGSFAITAVPASASGNGQEASP